MSIKPRKLGVGILVAIILLVLIQLVLLPPATSIKLSPGTPTPDEVTNGNTITFVDVNLTITAPERIPVAFLNLTVFKDGTEAYVKFYIDGTKIIDYPENNFAITNVTDNSNIPYNATSGGYGYDPNDGQDYQFGYGYGYSNASCMDVNILYNITYSTHETGTFYAKLYVNSTNHTFISDRSSTFTVNAVGGGDGVVEEEEEPSVTKQASDTTRDDVATKYNVTLNQSFVANDTDGDGKVDTFEDPNNKLTAVNTTTIDNHTTFLVSADNDTIPEFFWDADNDTATSVTHNVGNVTDTAVDRQTKTATVTVSIEKANWTYIEVTDHYPDIANVTVKTEDNRTISPDRIWRKDGKIYILDDPATTYQVIYGFQADTTPPTIFISRPLDGATLSGTVNVTTIADDNTGVDYVNFYINNTLVFTDNTAPYNWTWNTTEYANDEYLLKAEAVDLANNSYADSTIIKVDNPPTAPFPWPLLIVVILVLILIAVIAILYKRGYF